MKHKLKHLAKFCCKPANELEIERDERNNKRFSKYFRSDR